MQYSFKGILTWLSTHRQIAPHSHRPALWLNTSALVFWFSCLYGITGNGRTSCKEQQDRCTHKPTGWILQKTSVDSSHVHYTVPCSSDGTHCGLVIHWPYPSWHSLKVRHVVNLYAVQQSDMKFGTMYKKTVTQPAEFICTHSTFGHTTVHSTQMHTALFQALYSLMSL